MRDIRLTLCGLLVSALPTAALAQEPVKIGLVTTLSGPTGSLGEEVRDSFLLAQELGGGSLGGVPVQIIIQDDAGKPGNGKQIIEQFVREDYIKVLTGLSLTNMVMAAVPGILGDDVTYVSASPGPSLFAGSGCKKGFFAVSWENGNQAEANGAVSNALGYKRVMVFASNYQAGKEAVAGFKREYKGEIISETYTKLDQMDFSVELAQVRQQKPDAVFEFQPGGVGITFLKQYDQAGLKGIPVVAGTLDDRAAGAIGDAALGVHSAANWNYHFKNPQSEAFVKAFQERYHRRPTFYAAIAFDTAQLIGSGLKATGGNVADQDAFRAALEKADFTSLRGSFKFSRNHFPIQDWYGVSVVADPEGKATLNLGDKVLSDHHDSFVGDCKM